MNIKEFDNAKFFSKIRKTIYQGSLNQGQVDGLKLIINYFLVNHHDKSLKWLSYILATAHHETNQTIQPIIELGGDSYFYRMYDKNGARPKTAKRLGNIRSGDGVKFPGMGHVQLTGRRNYKFQGEKFNIPLENDPRLMLEDKISVPVMVEGMIDGDFTGRSLKRYTKKSNGLDFYNARRIINGDIEKNGRKIADYAEKFLAAINDSKIKQIEEMETINPNVPESSLDIVDLKSEETIREINKDKIVNFPKPLPKLKGDKWHSGIKTHMGSVLMILLGVAGAFGLVPSLEPSTAYNLIQDGLIASGFRGALTGVLILSVKVLARKFN